MKTSQPTPTEAQLRAYLDKTLPAQELEQIEQALAQSPLARAALDELRQTAAKSQAALAGLAPTQADHSSAPLALARLRAHLEQEADTPINQSIGLKGLTTMLNRPFVKRYQSAITAVTVLVALVIAFSFAPVRAAAGDLLKIFRVQQVKVISVDVDRLRDNEELHELVDRVAPDSRVVVDGGEPVDVASLSEAANRVGYTPAEVTAPPADAGDRVAIKVQNRSVNEVKVDLETARAIFDAAQIDVALPDSLQDTPITITRPATVMQAWGNTDEPTLILIQMPSPEIEYPDDLDLNGLGVAGLQLLGYSEADAQALAATIDWTNTLLFPVPSDADVEVSEVSVNGGSGVLFREAEGDKGGVMWQKDGRSYFLAGPYSSDQILQAAESVR